MSPKTKEVIELHRIYLRSAIYFNDGFKLKKLGFESKDKSILQMADKKFKKGRDEIDRWDKEIMVLYKKHGVAPIEVKKK